MTLIFTNRRRNAVQHPDDVSERRSRRRHLPMVIIFLLLGSLFKILVTISNSVNETKHPHAGRSLGKDDKPGYVHDEKSLHNNTDLNERFNAQEQLIQSILNQIEAMKGQANSTEENNQMNTGEKQAQEDLRKKLDEEKSKRSDLENKISLFDEKSKTQEQLIQFLLTQMERVDVRNISSTQPVAVFYNVFASKIEDLDYVMHDIVKEQMHMINPKLHDVYVRSIGMPFSFEFLLNQGNPSKGDLSITRIQHDSTGNEVGTLKLLWDYCNLNPERSVVYLHSKGSFTRNESNDQLRKFLTRGALSEECANIPNSCNVCSSRFSPVPHPHTSGNMWLAKCSYVKNLIDPLKFEEAMNKLRTIRRKVTRSCVGRGRFAAEHWIHSHPSVKPCDVSDELSFVWNYDNIPKPDFKIDLKPAPRFHLTTYDPPNKKRACGKIGLVKEDRLVEYRELYGEVVPDSWWGFDLFNDVDVQALLRRRKIKRNDQENSMERSPS